MRCDGQRLVSALMTLSIVVLAALPVAAAGPETDVKAKAPKQMPSQRPGAEREASTGRAQSLAGRATPLAAADTTPPTPPPNLVAAAEQLGTITASWSPAQDPESGIWDYVFAIGTHASSADGPLDDVRGWQVTYDTSISVSLTLDPSVTYYVSVAAVNNAQLYSSIVTSNGVRPVAQPLGQSGNAMTVAFSSAGYDASGNPAAGWTADQIATMQAFIGRMYPILVDLYGAPAVSYTVTVVRDLRYTNSDIFIPAALEIRMADTFNPQLFTHELIHAFRQRYLLSSNQAWSFDPTLSGFEEGFAQAVSYEAMNVYVAAYPSDPLVPANGLWDSSYEWDYDFQNVAELRGTDFWSTSGATGILWLKYEMAAAALRKINIESPGFYKRFNQEYYRRLNADPALRPSRALLVDIVRTVVPSIEGMPADAWVNAQLILYCQNVYGKKVFYNLQDYPATDFYTFDYIHFFETMSCGSEWACYDGTQWVYHRLNGSPGTGSLADWTGATVWSAPLLIEPIQNPADGYFGFGSDAKHLTTAASQLPWPGGSADDFVFNVDAFGLYRFTATFTDTATGQTATSSFYRPIGDAVRSNFRGVWGGVLGSQSGTIYIDHEGLAPEAGLAVVNGAFAGPRSWTGIPNARTGARDSLPGRVFVTFVDGATGATYRAQRNIGYGNWNGSQMFLFDFTASASPPTVSLTSPAAGAAVSGAVALTASASSGSGIARVEFYQGSALIGTAAAAPYTATWNTAGLPQGAAYTLSAKAFDAAGRSAASAPVSVTLADTTAPAVSITSPAAGSAVNGTVTIAATATDNVGVARAEFYVDGALLATSTAAPYAAAWNTAGAAAGAHVLTAKVFDAASNSATSAGVSVTVDGAKPAVSLTAPAANAQVSGAVTLSATASDNVGVARVEFYVDGALVATDTASPYSATWNADAAALGAHAVSAIAYDRAGNSAGSASRSITVVDKVKPAVSISQPADGGRVSRGSTVAIGATASDNRAVARVEFYVNNVLRCTDTQPPYSCSWAVPAQNNVTYTLRARAYDAANNTADATVRVTAR